MTDIRFVNEASGSPLALANALMILPLHNRTRSMRWLTRSRSGRRAVDVA